MSYDINLTDPKTGETIQLETPLDIHGGMYQVGGTTEMWLNITYNYSSIFYKIFGEKGIRTLYGMTGEESIPLLTKGIMQLKNDMDPNYWECTEGNAKKALIGLLTFALMRPDGIWNGD